jgi:ABC-type uncharacterized transport system involved in gliding motility auxiliary subunit
MNRSQALLAAFAILAAAFFVNLIFGAVGARADLTEDRTFTLSQGSRRIVGRLEEPLTLEFFVSRSDVKLPARYESYSRRVETLLREYVAASGGKAKLVITDPKPDSPEEQRAQRHGLSALRAPQGSAYLGLTVQLADTVKAAPVLDPSRERFLEFDITKLIASAARLERPKLALISSLPITAPSPQGGDQQPGPADVLLAELGQTFEVVTLNTTAKELPAGVAVVALVHAHHVDEQLSYAVDQFLLNGGPVFAAVDPLSRMQKFSQGNMPFMMAPMALTAASDPALLRAWGVNVEMDAVTADGNASLTLGGSRGEVSYPAAFAAGKDAFAKDSPLTSELGMIAFMEPGALSLISGAEKRLKLEPLVTQAGPGVGAINVGAANAGPFEKVAVGFKPDGRPRVLVASVTGEFATAFPRGAPKPGAPEPTPPGQPPAPVAKPHPGPHLAVSKKPGRLIVVADSDFMMDPFTVRQRQVGGQIAAEPINDNLGFVVSALETLAGSDELVGLRTKGTALRPFKVVDKLERDAQARFQAKLEEIDRRLEEAKNKVAELSRQTGGVSAKGTIVITPEMQREIEKFQKEADKLAEERRLIRRGLTDDIKSLGRTLQLWNLFAGPLVALLFGVFYTLARRRKLS